MNCFIYERAGNSYFYCNEILFLTGFLENTISNSMLKQLIKLKTL